MVKQIQTHCLRSFSREGYCVQKNSDVGVIYSAYEYDSED